MLGKTWKSWKALFPAELFAELKAIRLWDMLYLGSSDPDEIDKASWLARRERETEILDELQTLTRLLKGPFGRA
jgi:hypothetical protein